MLENLVHKPVDFWAGQISDYVHVWGEYTTDEWVLQQVKGVTLPFVELPVQESVPSQYYMSEEKKQAIRIQLSKMQAKGVIEEAQHCSGEWISNIFPRPKPDGEVRIILDLTSLNKYIEYQHFKMTGLKTAIDMLDSGAFMSSLDLKDAYYSVNISQEDRKYLRFIWDGVLYQYTALPNGVSCAPRFFTKMLTPLFSEARKQGVECFQYIDDIFIVSKTEKGCGESVHKLAQILDSVGLVIHPEKSSLRPSTLMKFLGFMLDSEQEIVYLPAEKVEKLDQVGCEVLCTEYPTIQMVSELVGILNAYIPGVEYGQAHIKSIERDKNSALVRANWNFAETMFLSIEAKSEILWWLNHAESNVRLMRKGGPDFEMETDASNEGWGAAAYDWEAGGRWAEWEKDHINVLELEAIYLGLKSFVRETGLNIHVATDNVTAKTYVNKGGGVRSRKCDTVAKKIWDWAEDSSNWVTASYIPGKLNVRADRKSREFQDHLEWSLSDNVFTRICKIFGTPDIDLFATRLNAKCPSFVARHPDPEAFHTDAFTMSWSGLNVYIFPPCSILFDVLRKIDKDRPSKAIVVAPDWPSAPWWTRLQRQASRRLVIGRKKANVQLDAKMALRYPKGVGLIISLL